MAVFPFIYEMLKNGKVYILNLAKIDRWVNRKNGEKERKQLEFYWGCIKRRKEICILTSIFLNDTINYIDVINKS